MGREETIIEREPLYAEVWAEPVRTVARRYRISDVALRKICQKLGVPVPPLGYWAKIAAGKKPPTTPLRSGHNGPTTHIRSVYVDEHAPERSRRVTTMLVETRPTRWPSVMVPETLDDCHPVIRRTEKAMRLRSRDETRRLCADGKDTFRVTVSAPQQNRALRVLEGVLRAFLAAGATLVSGKSSDAAVHLEIVEQHVNLSIEELLDRSMREPTAAERAKLAKYSWTRLDLRVYTPSGKLKITVQDDTGYSNYLTASDGMQTKLDERLADIVERVWAKAVEKNVRSQMQAEEHQRWKEADARRVKWEAVRKSELDRLEETEKLVEQWHRATLLRQYALALRSKAKDSASEPDSQEHVGEVAWIQNAADWLDPLVEKHWPLVDGD